MTLALSLLGSLIVQHVQRPTPVLGRSELGMASLPQPGIYESRPFSGLVVVPPDQPFDRMVVAPPETATFQLRIVSPELELIPRGR